MRFLKLLLCASLIFTTAKTLRVHKNPSKNNKNGTVDYSLEPIHYNVKITPELNNTLYEFHGECNISFKIRYATRNISLHLALLAIKNEHTVLTDNNGAMYIPEHYKYHAEQHILDYFFDKKLSPGFYTLYVAYADIPHRDKKSGIYRTYYYDDEGYIVWLATKPFVTLVVRRKLECSDDPVLRPTYNISVQHDRKYKVLSNMPIREEYNDENGMIWSHFDTTPQMISCRTVVVILNLKLVTNANKTINMWCRSNLTSQAQFAQNIAEQVVQKMVWYTKISEKIPKTDHILIPNFIVTGLSNWGLIVYDEENFINASDVTRTRYVMKTIAQEIIRQWFGNLVSVTSLSDAWLNKGFILFLRAYIIDKIAENWQATDFLVIENMHKSLRADTNLMMNSLTSGIDKSDDYALTNKASAIIRMLQQTVTEEVFQKGVNIFLRTHQFKSAISDDLWTAMQTALDESNVLHKNFKVKEVMDPWINQLGYPLVKVTRNYTTGEVIISQEDYSLQKGGKIDVTPDKWWIPITYTTQTYPDFTNLAVNFHWLSPKDENIRIKINPNDWIILNLQQSGYYRVNYDTTNWQKITDYLHTIESTKINGLNCAQLIDDAFNLVIRKQLDISIFLNLTNYLTREADYIVWHSMFNILSTISEAFSIPECKNFTSRLTGIFDGLLQNVGSEESSYDDDIIRMKRLSTLHWACLLDNPACKKMAATKLITHLTYPNSYLSPTLYHWTYCTGLKIATMTTWNKVFSLYLQNSSRTLLECLACSEDPNIIIHYVNITSSNDTIRRKRDYKFAFNYVITKHARNDLVLDYLLGNIKKIKPNSLTMTKTLKKITLSVVSKKQFSKIRDFVEDNIKKKRAKPILNRIKKRWAKRWAKLKHFIDLFGNVGTNN